MVVYLDELFFNNFLIDFVILLASSVCIRKKSWLRICLGALFGAIYGCAAFFIEQISWIGLKIVSAFIMIYITFGWCSMHEFLKRLAVFGITVFISCGVMSILLYSGGISLISKNGIAYMGISYIKWLFGAAVCYPVVVWMFKMFRRKNDRKTYRIKIKLFEKEIQTEALMDTGNCLHDPIKGRPVVLAEWDVMKNLFPDVNSPPELYMHGDKYKIGFIPYNVVGDEGILTSVDADVEIVGENKCIERIPVAIVEKPLSADGEYHGLLQSELL